MKKIYISIFVLVLSIMQVFYPALVFADDDNCVSTSILGQNNQVCDNNGDSITGILKLVVDIMSIGIGILGVIGIAIVGTQYLTAGGSEEKTRKAKRRMFEIVLGLVAYAVIYTALRWLLPGFRGF